MPLSTKTLSRLQFYVFHQEIVAQCQAWLQEKANLGLLDETEPLFYGFANGEPGLSEEVSKYKNRSIKYACISILREKGFDFGAYGFRMSANCRSSSAPSFTTNGATCSRRPGPFTMKPPSGSAWAES